MKQLWCRWVSRFVVVTLAAGVLAAFTVTAAFADTSLKAGSWAVVAGTYGNGLRVRTGPGIGEDILTALPEGTSIQIIEGPTSDGTYQWYHITGFDNSGTSGWSVGDFLQAAPPPAGGAGSTGGGQGRTVAARLTAYSAGDGSSGSWGNVTAIGTPLRWGVVAVDPNYIPLGSHLKIQGFDNIFVAEDTGGAVKGYWVDIWLPDVASAVQFGVQRRPVTILP